MKRFLPLFIILAAFLLSSCDSPFNLSGSHKLQTLAPNNAASPIPLNATKATADSIRKNIWKQFKRQNGRKWRIRWNKQTGLPVSMFFGKTKKAYHGSAKQAARAFLADHAALLGFGNFKNLRYLKTRKFRGIRYVVFNEVVKGVPVYEAQYVVHLTSRGQVNMVNGHFYPHIQVSTSPSVPTSQAVSIARADMKITLPKDMKETSKLVIYHGKKRFHLAWKLLLSSRTQPIDWLYMIDAHSGDILKKFNLISDFAGKVTANGSVHLAHLLLENKLNNMMVTGDGNVYPTYPLNSSVTNESLYRLNGNGYLTGKYVKVVNDQYSRAYSPSESFQYSSINPHFDEVNLYYHIDLFRQHFINQFGSDSQIGFTQVTAHAHAPVSVSPNAWFKPSNQELYFNGASQAWGTKDFAKSDYVIYHEYSHAVIYHLNSNIVSSPDEEGAINEGVPDYWAGSYIPRSHSGQYVAPGSNNSNGIWRNMENPEPISTYSLYISNQPVDPHNGGEFFSSILWNIRQEIGAGKTDLLVYKSLHGISNNPTFLGFRDQMIQADIEEYNGDDYNTIINVFSSAGIYHFSPSYLDVSISGPTYVQAHQSVTYTGSVSNNQGSVIYDWFIKPVGEDYWVHGASNSQTLHISFINYGTGLEKAGVQVAVREPDASEYAASTARTIWVEEPDVNMQLIDTTSLDPTLPDNTLITIDN